MNLLFVTNTTSTFFFFFGSLVVFFKSCFDELVSTCYKTLGAQYVATTPGMHLFMCMITAIKYVFTSYVGIVTLLFPCCQIESY